MLCQYRTNIYEFTKDSLLGDKYVDDEEMEKSLNEMGGKGWELVSVSLLQDGLLVFLKRPVPKEVAEEPPLFVEPEKIPAVPLRPVVYPQDSVPEVRVQEVEREPIRGLDRPRKNTRQNEEKDFVGDIKIS